MTPPPKLTVDYHVNYRGPNYLTDVWYLCGAFDNLAEAQVNIDLVYVATGNRVVFGAADMDALRAALDRAA